MSPLPPAAALRQFTSRAGQAMSRHPGQGQQRAVFSQTTHGPGGCRCIARAVGPTRLANQCAGGQGEAQEAGTSLCGPSRATLHPTRVCRRRIARRSAISNPAPTFIETGMVDTTEGNHSIAWDGASAQPGVRAFARRRVAWLAHEVVGRNIGVQGQATRSARRASAVETQQSLRAETACPRRSSARQPGCSPSPRPWAILARTLFARSSLLPLPAKNSPLFY